MVCNMGEGHTRVLCTIVAGPVQWGVSTAVHDDRHGVLGVCGLQQGPQHPDVTARCRQVHGCAPSAVSHTHAGPVLQQRLHTHLVPRHRLQTQTRRQHGITGRPSEQKNQVKSDSSVTFSVG